MTDNVVDLLAGRVGELAEATQEALRTASVIGNTFDLATLAPTLGLAPNMTVRVLADAIQAGFVLPLGDDHELMMEGFEGRDPSLITYRFLHDRVQQASFSLLSPAEVATIHRQVGRLHLERLRSRGRDEDLFDVVGHLNAGIEAEADPEHRLELAHLNLEAARKAKASNAYEAAADYVDAGLRLLPPDPWDNHYDLTFGLRLLQTQVLTVLGHGAEAEGVFDELLAWARNPLDRAVACDVHSEALHSVGRPAEGYAAARAGLEHLGVRFPATPEETAEETAALVARLLDPTVVDRLERLPEGDEQALLMGRLFFRAVARRLLLPAH